MKHALAVSLLLLHTAAGFLWSRASPLRRSSLASTSENDEVSLLKRRPKGQSAILLPRPRVLLPGATRSFHMFDANMLLALEHARGDELVFIT